MSEIRWYVCMRFMYKVMMVQMYYTVESYTYIERWRYVDIYSWP